MRRFVSALAVLVSAAALSACAGGGSVLGSNSQNPTGVIITAASPTNLARVLPGGGIALSAVRVNGSQNGFLSGNNYRWSAALTTGQSYASDTAGNLRPCSSVTVTTGGVTAPYTADFPIYIALDPVNEANVVFGPPTVLPTPAGSTATIRTA